MFVPVAETSDVADSETVPEAPAASVTEIGATDPVQPLGSDVAASNVRETQPESLFLIVAVYVSAEPAVPDCVDGDSVTDGAAVVQVTTNDAVPVVEPLAPLLAVTPTVFVPFADWDGVAFSVTVVDAPDASVTLPLVTLPVQPLGTLEATANVPLVQPLSLFLIVAV